MGLRVESGLCLQQASDKGTVRRGEHGDDEHAPPRIQIGNGLRDATKMRVPRTYSYRPHILYR